MEDNTIEEGSSVKIAKVSRKVYRPIQVPVRCPVCSGYTTVAHGTKPCGACKAMGYILVDAMEEFENGVGTGRVERGAR